MKVLLRSLLVLTLICFISCDKSLLGEGLLSEDDKITGTFTDTCTIVTELVNDVSVRSDRLTQLLLGSMVDPIFGKTSAGMMVEFGLPIAGLPDTVKGYSLDSIFLNLQLTGFYGDTTIPQTFVVFKILEPFDKQNTYFSDLTPGVSMIEVGRVENVLFRPKSKTTIGGEPSDLKRIRIQLSDVFGASLVNHIKTEATESNSNFEKFLPGLFVVPDTTSFGGGVASVNLNSLVSNMTVHYKNSKGNRITSVFTTFISGFNINTYRHNYNGTVIADVLNNPEFSKEVSYVQGASGLKTKVLFPHIENLKNKAILKAELEVTEIYDDSRITFTPLVRLLAIRKDGDKEANLRDYIFFGENHFRGIGVDSTNLEGKKVKKYKLNITDYFKNLLLEKYVNEGIFITSYIAQEKKGGETNSNIYTPARVVIGGSDHPVEEYKMKLLLRYTGINE